MIDLTHEALLSLSEAARTMPGGGVHVCTLHRWRLRGIRAVRLEAVLRGGTWYTSKEALERFVAGTTAAANGEDGPSRTSKQREAAIQAAERELDAAGI